MVPGSVLFLAVYALTIARLRGSPRQRGALVVVVLATLAGLVACALAFGLLLGAFMPKAGARGFWIAAEVQPAGPEGAMIGARGAF
jgi:hypothetical protein